MTLTLGGFPPQPTVGKIFPCPYCKEGQVSSIAEGDIKRSVCSVCEGSAKVKLTPA